ncbi:MAG: hydrogenase maturation protease [Blastocatellia bacterium]
MKILVAGVGNVLRGDDGFGIRVIEALLKDDRIPDGVDLYEAGIAGIALVQELMNGYDALIVADAVDKGVTPGTLFVLEPITPDAGGSITTQEDAIRLHQSMVDAHYAEPSKVLMLARALNVCPPQVFIVGCQPACLEEPVEHLDPAVKRAVTMAVERVLSLIETLKQTTPDLQG